MCKHAPTHLLVNFSKIHDEPVWPDPGEFKPERFLTERPIRMWTLGARALSYCRSGPGGGLVPGSALVYV
ncbi:hypothetical protein CRG98_050177 [Punica granatum]|nr:hypothetical protein CRG98_050177 [Punica granatum]